MKYKKYVSKITSELKSYRQKVDELEKQYKNTELKTTQEIEQMRGKYTEEYISEYKKGVDLISKFKPMINQARDQARPVVDFYLDLIEKEINGYFNAPVSTNFANKINAISLTGIKLSDTEFQILQDSANSYMERRLLNHLAESRTRSVENVTLDSNHNPVRGNMELGDPFQKIELPDIEKTYTAFDNFKRSINFLLNNYSGNDATLSECLDNTPKHISITADSYFRNKSEETFVEVLEKANAILPESKIKKSLSENDIKLIDTLVDPKYPTLAKSTVENISKVSPELSELFALDERYKDYVCNEE